ncbi:MAG: hypothetical protein BGO78_07580 [Chloroflexi bacterium 44-23]|nr:MAG: hypothetical protein BGO78_07580 [Chloroflexi bacterium 44-23]
MTFIKSFTSVAILMVFILTACSSTPVSLAETGWVLTNLSGNAPIDDTTITLTFQDGNIGGSDGCNRYNSSYTQDGSKLKVGPNIASTLMACQDDIMQQASKYHEILSQIESFKVDGNQLILYGPKNKELARFEKQNTDLSGTSWLVTGFNNGKGAVTSTIIDSELTLAFNEKGAVSGNAGCNTFSGSYTLAGNKITFSNMASTLKACLEPEGLMEQETEFLTALSTVDTYRVEGSQLEMRTADGAIALTLTRQ